MTIWDFKYLNTIEKFFGNVFLIKGRCICRTSFLCFPQAFSKYSSPLGTQRDVEVTGIVYWYTSISLCCCFPTEGHSLEKCVSVTPCKIFQLTVTFYI